MPPFHERQPARPGSAPLDLLSPLPPRQDHTPRPSASEVEALLRRREQRLEMLKSNGTGQAPLARPGAELDAETRLSIRRLAESSARSGQTSGLVPVLRTALRDEPEQAAAEVRLLLGELRGRDPQLAETLESQIAEDIKAIQGTLPNNRTPRNTAYDTRKDPLFGGQNEDQVIYFAKQAVPAIPENLNRENKKIEWHIKKDSPQWPEFHKDLIDAKTSALERYIFRTLFSHEGGLEPDWPKDANHPSVGGITEETLIGLRGSDYEETQNAMTALGIDSNDPRNLNNAQRIEVMRLYFDDVMRSARIGAEKRRGRPVSAIDLLAGLRDSESAAALADTLYRMGGPRGIPLIQESINAFYEARGLPNRIHVENVSKGEEPAFGSRTYGAFKAIVQDPRDRKLLLDLIADRRTVEYPREAWRNDYHRIPQNLPAAPEIIP